jgi:hypothetical protein
MSTRKLAGHAEMWEGSRSGKPTTHNIVFACFMSWILWSSYGQSEGHIRVLRMNQLLPACQYKTCKINNTWRSPFSAVCRFL